MNKHTNKDTVIKVSSSFRFIENGHILLWLIKDTCWAMTWRAGGMTMITPTLGVAIYILWQSRHNRSEVFHHLAICLWIAANTLWMTGEFYKMELRPFVAGLFFTGLAVLLVYYVFFFAADRRAERERQTTIP